MYNYLKIIILPLLVLICLFLVWMFVKPIFDQAQKINQTNIPQIENLIQQESDLQQRSEKLSEGMGNNDQGEVVKDILPNNMENKGLITQIEFLIGKEKMKLANINIQDQPASDLSSNGILAAGRNYKEIGGNFEVRGTYSQFKQILADLKKLNRLINVYSINVANTSGDEGGATGKFTLYFTAYWQSPISAQDVRMGLESQELSGNNGVLPANSIPNSMSPTSIPNPANNLE